MVTPLGAAAAQRGAPAADSVVVRSAAPPVWGSNVSLAPLFSIGKLDGPPEYSFGIIDGIAVDRKNRFYLYDAKDGQVRAYDSTGKFVRAIGRKGDGPGEYRFVAAMDVVDDSLLATYDPGSGQVTFFNPSGTVRRFIRNGRFTNWADGWFAADASGLIYVRTNILAPGVAMENSEGPGAVTGAQFLLYRSDGRLVDSVRIPNPPSRSPQPRAFYLMGPEGGSSNFLNEWMATPSPAGGVVYGYNDAYRFGIKPPTGPTRIVERPWVPVPVQGAERDNWIQWADFFRAQDARSGGPPRPPYEIPKTKPAYKELFVDRDGRVWVSLFTAAERRDDIPPRPAGDTRPRLIWRQRATYDVFDKGGAYLGRVTLPRSARVVAAQGDRVWVLSKDVDDVESITVYRVNRQ
jgi:hypothetical protein